MNKEIVIKMLKPIIINDLMYEQEKRYKIPFWIATELCKEGYCWYTIKPQNLT
jgi:hypothetical protein